MGFINQLTSLGGLTLYKIQLILIISSSSSQFKVWPDSPCCLPFGHGYTAFTNAPGAASKTIRKRNMVEMMDNSGNFMGFSPNFDRMDFLFYGLITGTMMDLMG